MTVSSYQNGWWPIFGTDMRKNEDTLNNTILLDRALAILHRMATEHTGWRQFIWRWYYSDEPLRNDAANLVREAQFGMPMPNDTRLVGDAN